ncbi:hypothetical protein [Nocardioides sp. YIM 152588]|uniref:hypothetical protein n=1 Tax=Nocardioides sp. YIM 152588 TaxID=3158259 RepID=UPI0032E39B6B
MDTAPPGPGDPTRRAADLEVGTAARAGRESRWWAPTITTLTVAVAVGWAAWYALTPEPLPISEDRVTAVGSTRAPVYIGMFTLPAGVDRTLHVAGVRTRATASGEVEVAPLLCRDGSIGVTSAPERFCAAVDDPAGATMADGDSIVLEVSADAGVLVEIERIRVAFREQLRWGTAPAGKAGATVTLDGATVTLDGE